jgi:transposase
MHAHITCVGIDISKATLDVALYHDDALVATTLTVANDRRGLLALRRRLHKTTADCLLLIGMEATGAYWQPVAASLHAGGARVYVLNPRCVKDSARAENQRQKTDRVDAGVIARHLRARRAQLHPWAPPTAAVATLRALLTRWDQLAQDLQREYNRRAEVQEPLVRASFRRMIRVLLQERRTIRAALDQHCTATPELQTAVTAVAAEPGIGRLSAMRLLAFLRTHPFTTARQAAAFVGITPRHKESGTSLKCRARISRVGDAVLRHALYFPAVVARHRHPILRPWADGLIARGKTPKQAVCAVMRRIVHIAFGIVKRVDREQPLLAA